MSALIGKSFQEILCTEENWFSDSVQSDGLAEGKFVVVIDFDLSATGCQFLFLVHEKQVSACNLYR